MTQSSGRTERDRDIIEMIMGLSNTYTNQQSSTNQQSGAGNRNYGSRRRSNWIRVTPPIQDGRRTNRYIMSFFMPLDTIDIIYSNVQF